MIAETELAQLHQEVEQALERGDEGDLRVIGWGEISLGVGWPTEHPEHVAKRLPVFPDEASFGRYAALVEEYAEELGRRGIRVLETDLRSLPRPDGTLAGYAVQPVLPAGTLGPAVLRGADPGDGHPLIELIVERTLEIVSQPLGLDPQVSNWSWSGGEATYFDVTTPFMRGAGGEDRMDFGLLLAGFPWALRGLLRRFVAPSIIAQFHDARTVIVDVCGNLKKERLEGWITPVLELANPRLDEPVSQSDVDDYYRSDARTWGLIQRVRRADRAWHRLTGRTYPFLLPGEIER
ncbi:MAG TPA: DUF6206 family protein [Solirubrobacterales bacterium]|nr:DUF6206 family protein [Solirubrobacterales bacterium]